VCVVRMSSLQHRGPGRPPNQGMTPLRTQRQRDEDEPAGAAVHGEEDDALAAAAFGPLSATEVGSGSSSGSSSSISFPESDGSSLSVRRSAVLRTETVAASAAATSARVSGAWAAQLSSVQHDNTRLQALYHDATMRLAQSEKAAQAAQEERGVANGLVRALESQLRDSQTKRIQSDAQSVHLRSQLTSTEASLAEVNRRAGRLEKKLAELGAKEGAQAQRLLELEHELQQLLQRNAALQARMDELAPEQLAFVERVVSERSAALQAALDRLAEEQQMQGRASSDAQNELITRMARLSALVERYMARKLSSSMSSSAVGFRLQQPPPLAPPAPLSPPLQHAPSPPPPPALPLNEVRVKKHVVLLWSLFVFLLAMLIGAYLNRGCGAASDEAFEAAGFYHTAHGGWAPPS